MSTEFKVIEHNVPFPTRISQWDSMTQIIHMCPKCGTIFSFYCEKELYCHNCGLKLNWNKVILRCTEEEKKLYHNTHSFKEQRELLYDIYKRGFNQTKRG